MKINQDKIIPGSWISTPNYENCVCLKVENNSVHFRYSAIRCVDKKQLWIYSVEEKNNVSWIAEPTKESLEILEIDGIYGEKI